MIDDTSKYKTPGYFTGGEFQVQEEILAVETHPQKLFIGIPKETVNQENRVALSPNSVVALTGRGHRVVVQNRGWVEF